MPSHKKISKKVGIVVKPGVSEATELSAQAAKFLERRGAKVFFEPPEKLIKNSDFIVIFGGDGTFISVARLMIERSIPMFGVHMGQLGFLTEIKKSELFEGLQAALEGKLKINERTMLECTLIRGDKTLQRLPIVNDVVIHKGAISHIFDMEVFVDQSLVTNVKADGLIIATPTGSTAYNLAAGGPIVDPRTPCIAITPICPHSLTLRPLVIPENSEVTVIPYYKPKKVESILLTLDGQVSFSLNYGDKIKVTHYKKHSLKIMHSTQRDYYSLLREKLKFGYRD